MTYSLLLGHRRWWVFFSTNITLLRVFLRLRFLKVIPWMITFPQCQNGLNNWKYIFIMYGIYFKLTWNLFRYFMYVLISSDVQCFVNAIRLNPRIKCSVKYNNTLRKCDASVLFWWLDYVPMHWNDKILYLVKKSVKRVVS